MLDHTVAPLLDALRHWSNAHHHRPHAPFYTPGHKRGRGIAKSLAEVFGAQVFQIDLPELPELDNLFAPEGVIQAAQELAADAFGADRTWFLANGSTCGIEAAMMATCRPGDKIILPRNAHQSAISGLILSGAMPVFVQPDYDAAWDIAHCATPDAIATALNYHPDAKAVMVIYPTYYGVCGDLEAIAHITHQHGIPLLVDEAHGAHFAFHPDLPTPALRAGADLVVQSTHKTLAAMTQASMMHLRGDRLSVNRLNNALRLVQSTSPSYLLLASLDAARQQMALTGHDCMAHTLDLAHQARTQLFQLPQLRVLCPDSGITPGFATLDPTRLTVDVTDCGLTGFAADEILHQSLGVTAELPSLRTLTFIISLGNRHEDIERLVWALQTLPSHPSASETTALKFHQISSLDLYSANTIYHQTACTPRQAFFATTESVAIAQTVGRISAELICPYPPGIPLLIPGEQITSEAIAYLQAIKTTGGLITGCADASLNALQVLQ
jgi:arginine decarboxylase